MQKEQTVQQIMQNLRSEIEKLSEHINKQQDNTTLFLIANYPDQKDEQTTLSALLGNQKESIKTLVATMEQHKEIARFILHTSAIFLSRNNSLDAKVIKIPVDSGLGKIIQEIIQNNNNDEPLKN